MRAPLLLTAILLLASSPASAQAVDCNNATSTVEMNICSDRDFVAADKALNSAYQRALATIADRDLEKPYDRSSWQKELRASQRAWLAFRDADCKGAVPMEWSGGTGTTSAVLGCMTEKTETRTRELTERYEDK